MAKRVPSDRQFATWNRPVYKQSLPVGARNTRDAARKGLFAPSTQVNHLQDRIGVSGVTWEALVFGPAFAMLKAPASQDHAYNGW